MGLLAGPENPLERDSCLISLACLGILLVLVLLCWMVPFSFDTIPFLLPAGSLLGGFLLVVRFVRSLQVLGPLRMHLMLGRVWVLIGGVLLDKVSKGSDLLRKLLVQKYIGFPQSQFRMQVFMTLWEIDLLGQGGRLPGGCMGCPVQEAGWIEKELAEGGINGTSTLPGFVHVA